MARTYSSLKDRIDLLASAMLPAIRPISGDYSQNEIDKTKAFVLLAHAEIEDFFEQVALEIVAQAEREWQQKGNATNVMSRLVVYWLARKNSEPELLSTKMVDSALSYYRKEVAANHGIKSKNILALLLPLGLTFDDFDATVLPTFDTFGEDRGIMAHKNWTARRQVDPSGEENRIKQVLLPETSRICQRLRLLNNL